MPIRSPDKVVEHRLSISKNLQPLVKAQIKKDKQEVIQGYIKSGAMVGGVVVAAGAAYVLAEGLKWSSGIYDDAQSWWSRRKQAGAAANKTSPLGAGWATYLGGMITGTSEVKEDGSRTKYWWE